MMWGSDYPHSESTFPQSRKILAEILAAVPEDEQAKIVGGNTARVYGFDVAKWAPMLEEPTSLRIEDPGVRALFTEAARFQSWLDVEAALAQAQAELGVIPAAAAREIVTKAHLKYLDLAAVRAGLAKTGHPLVPLVWELDRACEGDAGGYVHWGATTQNITQTGQLLQVRRAHEIFLRQLASVLTHLAGLAERTKDALLPGPHARPARGAGDVRLQGRGLDR